MPKFTTISGSAIDARHLYLLPRVREMPHFHTSASSYQEINSPPVNHYLSLISSIHTIIFFVFIFYFLFLLLLLIFHFIIKLLPHSAYLSHPLYRTYQLSHSSFFLFIP